MPRGRLLQAGFAAAAPPAAKQLAVGWTVPALVLTLPMFWQSFQYMIDAGPLYFVSKVWPVLCLPAALWGVFALRLPYATYYVIVLAYVLGISPAMSMIELPNSFLEAAITTAKTWSFSFYFALSAVLVWLRPGLGEMRRATLVLAAITGLAMWGLWLFAPLDAYKSDPTLSQVFLFDDERGFRIVLPMSFAMLGLFYIARCMARSPRLWHVVAIGVTFATMLIIYKQRLAILAAILVTGFAATARLRARMPLVFLALLLLSGAAAVAVAVLLPDRLLSQSLGSSLSIRQVSADLAWRYVSDDPVRLLLGVGATTSYSSITVAEVLHFKNFFAADIGWVGVLFEYGLVGSGLIAGAYAMGVLAARRAAQGGAPFAQALFDWTLYQILVTSVYSVVYTPGEMASAMAMAVYAERLGAGRPRKRIIE